MKKLVITMGIILISILGYSQSTNVGELRVADEDATFTTNVPIGTKVYQIDTKQYWVVTAGIAAGTAIKDATASLTLLNNSGTDNQNASQVEVTATGNLASENVQDALEELQGDIDQNTTDISTNTAAVTAETTRATNAEAANATNITTNETNIATNAAAITAEETRALAAEGANATNITTNASDIADNTTDIATNSATIASNTTNIATNTSNIATNATAIAAINKLTSKTDSYSVAADDFDGSDYTLTQTAIAQYGIQVTINGAKTTGFTFGSNKVSLSIPVYKYDIIVVTYTYSAS